MSAETQNEQGGKSGRGLVVAAVVGVLAIAAAGTMVMSQKSDAQTGADADAAPPKAEAVASAGEPAAQGDSIPLGDGTNLRMGDPVVAEIGGEKIMRSDVFNFIATLPEQVRQMPLQTLFPLALDQVLNNKIVTMKANEAKIAADPEVEKLMETAKEQIVRNVYVERELGKAVSQKDLLKAYEKVLEGFERVDEVRARHILVPDEEKARAIIKQLDEGAKFEDLVKDSVDAPTAQNGGDLGYFSKDQMIPEFAEAAFALAPGKYSKEPVKTQFGFHVVKVEEKRKRPEPEFELLKPQLEAQVRREKLNGMLESWQKDAKIKKFDINGDAVKAETKKN